MLTWTQLRSLSCTGICFAVNVCVCVFKGTICIDVLLLCLCWGGYSCWKRVSVWNTLSCSNLTPLIPSVEKMLYWMPQPRVHKGKGITMNWYWLTPASRSGTFHKWAYRNYSSARKEQLQGEEILSLSGYECQFYCCKSQLQLNKKCCNNRSKLNGPTHAYTISNPALIKFDCQ